jgi:hypothetical protein
MDHETQNPLQRIGVLLAVVLTIAATVALVALLLTGGETTADPATTTIPAATTTVPDEQVIAPPTVVDADAKVKAWNENIGPTIQKIIVEVSAPPAASIDVLRLKCERVKALVKEAGSYPKAPREDVAESFTNWLAVLEDAAIYCTDGSKELPDTDAVAAAGNNLGATGAYFETFIQTIGRYVDLSQAPSNAPQQGGNAP